MLHKVVLTRAWVTGQVSRKRKTLWRDHPTNAGCDKGGSIGLNPTVQVSHRLLGEPSAIELAGIIASLGLAQNFAALKALVTTGIQAGHMKLQARSLALLAGAKEEEVPRLVSQLLENKPFNLEKAQTLLQELRK